VPAIIPLLTTKEVIENLDVIVQNLDLSIKQINVNIEISESEIQVVDHTLQRLDNEMKKSCERYECFQSLFSYIEDLTEFLDVLAPQVENLEQEFYKSTSDDIKRQTFDRFKSIKKHAIFFKRN
jgi:hypothetical protein